MAGSNPVQLEFSRLGRRRLVGNFNGGDISADGGLALLREADNLIDLLPRAAACFADHRNPAYVVHSVLDLVRQRVYGICGGYEDLADHNRLRSDPLLGMLLERSDGSALGSAATLCRLENWRPDKAPKDRYRRIAANFAQLDDLLVEVFVESYPEPPARIVLRHRRHRRLSAWETGATVLPRVLRLLLLSCIFFLGNPGCGRPVLSRWTFYYLSSWLGAASLVISLV